MIAHQKKARQRGFSLPELLVALLIFSIIAATAVIVLRQSVDTRDQLGAVSDEVANIEIARAMIKDDLAQIALRPVRDAFGAVAGPAFRDGYSGTGSRRSKGEERLVVFVRRGWSNPGSAAPRSSLQYVEYIKSDNALLRRTRPYMDAAREQPVNQRVLIDNIDSVEVEFLVGEVAGRLEWARHWPNTQSTDGAPRAIAITTQSARFGELRQLFWIGDLKARVEAPNG